jgi:hypothetical protein
MRTVGIGCVLFFVAVLCVPRADAETEMQRLMRRLLSAPQLQTALGFTARVIVPPGELYDPLWMIARGDVVWLNDDGGEKADKGSRILSLDRSGHLSPLADLGTLLPVTGFDLAPESFAPYTGQLFTIAQPEADLAGLNANHVIQRIDPARGFAASVFCTLPRHGKVNKGIAGFGADARFGPDHSPFAGRFFAVTILNGTIYQVTPDGACTPFASFDDERTGRPFALQFSPDHTTMLVSTIKYDATGTRPRPKAGGIVRVKPDGGVEEHPVASGFSVPGGMAFAPDTFGCCRGEMFVADSGSFEVPVPMGQPLAADGKIYRVSKDGHLAEVASGFVNPAGLLFVGDALWVTDIAGDFIGGRRELPDGFVVELRHRPH